MTDTATEGVASALPGGVVGGSFVGVLDHGDGVLELRLSLRGDQWSRGRTSSLRLRDCTTWDFVAADVPMGPGRGGWEIGSIEEGGHTDGRLSVSGAWGTLTATGRPGCLVEHDDGIVVLQPEEVAVLDAVADGSLTRPEGLNHDTLAGLEGGDLLRRTNGELELGPRAQDVAEAIASAEFRITVVASGEHGAETTTVLVGRDAAHEMAMVDGVFLSFRSFSLDDLFARLADRTGLSRSLLEPPRTGGFAAPGGGAGAWVSCRLEQDRDEDLTRVHEAVWQSLGDGLLWMPDEGEVTAEFGTEITSAEVFETLCALVTTAFDAAAAPEVDP